jgi:hypothetical protein
MAPLAPALLLALTNLTSTDAPLSVRVVSPFYQPLAGVTVRLVQVDNCGDRTPQGPEIHSRSRADGQASFQIAADHSYLLTSAAEGGFRLATACFDSAPRDVTPTYVQLRLLPDPKETVTLFQPSIQTGKRGRIVKEDFVGRYSSGQDAYYVVELLNGGSGLRVITPAGRELFFATRKGPMTFAGRDGTIRFEQHGGRVTGFTLSEEPVKATHKREDWER